MTVVGTPHTALLVSVDLPWALALGSVWAEGGATVTVVLLDTAAGAARAGHADADAVRSALDAGLLVRAERGALQRRALPPDRLLDGVKVVDLDEVADLVAEGADTVVWL